ncbi:hypothetical protein [Amorphus sp. 3PC139-8]|uniref:hypothetical protein n=1 Tax=Amorphus sp. 3PC139-8 TaxID=2735676 RepID=UPI00345D7F3D
MDPSLIVLAVVLVILLGYLAVCDPGKIIEALRSAGRMGRLLVFRIPLAILAASLLGRLIPTDYVSALIGHDSGFLGILLATVVGAVVPGGPMLSFPLALIVWQLGAGQPQMVAFLTSWSVFALHRILSYELPLLGPRFVLVRMVSSLVLPTLAGLIAAGLILLWHGADPPPGDTSKPGRSAAHAAEADTNAVMTLQ